MIILHNWNTFLEASFIALHEGLRKEHNVTDYFSVRLLYHTSCWLAPGFSGLGAMVG